MPGGVTANVVNPDSPYARFGEAITSSSVHCGACQWVGGFAFPAAVRSESQPNHTAQTNGATVAKSIASATIVEAVHSHSNGTASLHAQDRNEFVREVLTLTHVRFVSSLLPVYVLSFTLYFLVVVVSVDGSLIC